MILYTSPDCQHCVKVKVALGENFTEITLDELLRDPKKASAVFAFSQDLPETEPVFPVGEDQDGFHAYSFFNKIISMQIN